jgi:hypothetical protein
MVSLEKDGLHQSHPNREPSGGQGQPQLLVAPRPRRCQSSPNTILSHRGIGKRPTLAFPQHGALEGCRWRRRGLSCRFLRFDRYDLTNLLAEESSIRSSSGSSPWPMNEITSPSFAPTMPHASMIDHESTSRSQYPPQPSHRLLLRCGAIPAGAAPSARIVGG